MVSALEVRSPNAMPSASSQFFGSALSYEPFYALSGWWPVTVAAAPPDIAAKTKTEIAIITSYILWARMWAQFTINYVSDYNKY